MSACLVAATCGWHWRAEAALEAGNVAFLREQMDVIEVLHLRAWRQCRCQLYERIVAAVSP